MNDTLELLMNRTTYRAFDSNFNIDEKTLMQIIKASKQAPSWMNGQPYRITIFRNDNKRKLTTLLSKDAQNLPNSRTIQNANVFLLFSIDFTKYEINESELDIKNELEPLLISSTDIGIALNNAVIAAESLNLRTCVIGGLRRISKDLIENFNFPNLTFPLVGIAIGKASDHPVNQPKPRLPLAINVHEASQILTNNTYLITQYENTLHQYAQKHEYISNPWQQRFYNFYQQKNFPGDTIQILKKQNLY